MQKNGRQQVCLQLHHRIVQDKLTCPIRISVEVKNPVFVDDQLMWGSKTQIEKTEAKLGFLEETKKYTYNNKKGKSEILSMKFGNKEEEKPTVTVGKGEIHSADLGINPPE